MALQIRQEEEDDLEVAMPEQIRNNDLLQAFEDEMNHLVRCVLSVLCFDSCDIILEEIKEEIEDYKYFSVLVDETKDLSKQEQMSFVIRYLYDGEVHEEFMGFRCAEGLDAELLSEGILKVA